MDDEECLNPTVTRAFLPGVFALVCDVHCDFITFPFGILRQVWYLIVSIPDHCCLSYFVVTVGGGGNGEYCCCSIVCQMFIIGPGC